MKRVIIESPFAGDVETNIDYARACVRDSLLRNEAPIASHLLYTQPDILRDDNLNERNKGMDAGFVWSKVADLIAVYTDRGISEGMKRGIEKATQAGVSVEFRSLTAWVEALGVDIGGR
jgi:hypothetical protein